MTRKDPHRTDGAGSREPDDLPDQTNKPGDGDTSPSIGRYDEMVTTLAEHTAVGGVHTFSVVDAEDGYIGYAGTFIDGPIDRWTSSDLERWERSSDEPIVDRPGVRWPSVLYDGETYWMAVRETPQGDGIWETAAGRWLTRQVSQCRVPFAIDRARRKFSSARPTCISLYTSEDGLDFQFDRQLVDPLSGGAIHNQNPYLLYDRESGVVLLYHRRTEDRWEIRYRSAPSVPALADTEDIGLASSSELLAAPAAFYHPGRDAYVLLVETIRNKVWYTEWVTVEELTAGFDPDDTTVLFNDDRACPFPYVEGRTLYLFVSRRLQDGILPQWIGEVHRYDVGDS